MVKKCLLSSIFNSYHFRILTEYTDMSRYAFMPS